MSGLRLYSGADLPKTRVSVKSFAKYFIFFLAGMQSCVTEDARPVDVGKDYLPLQKGVYQVYTVQETQYTDPLQPTELSYQLMTEIVDSFPATDGGYTYVIYRSTRPDESSPWEYKDTWSVHSDDQQAVVQEGNESFIKISFPVREGRVWNGNALNIKGEDVYALKDIQQSFTLPGVTFDNTITVEQEDNQDLIVYQDKRFEVYARDIGLVYKELIQLEYCTQPSCIGQQLVVSGLIYKQSLLTHGKK